MGSTGVGLGGNQSGGSGSESPAVSDIAAEVKRADFRVGVLGLASVGFLLRFLPFFALAMAQVVVAARET